MVSKRVTRTLTIVLVIFLLISVTAAGFYFGFSYVLSQNGRFDQLEAAFEETGHSPITETTPGAIEIIIPRASDTKDIAEILEDKGMIGNTLMFTILSKFNGFDGNYIAGTHYLMEGLSYDEIMFILTRRPQPVQVTFPEGISYRQMKQRLKEAGVKYDENALDNMMRRPNLFLDYDFVKQIKASEDRDWLLQGYLFPDTYYFDVNSDEETIIRTFLNNTEKKLTQEIYDRADYMNMTIDEAITLASIIQAEASDVTEMADIGGVFHNRMKAEMTLSSDTTINYLRSENNMEPVLWLTLGQIEMFNNNAYSTHANPGLPPGPINSPGIAAIEAALWPANNGYYYFSATGEDGKSQFTSSYEQHQANIAAYQQRLEEEANETNQE
jgi:UPF0755 protein